MALYVVIETAMSSSQDWQREYNGKMGYFPVYLILLEIENRDIGDRL